MKTEITDEQLIALIEGNEDKDLEEYISKDPTLQKRMEELKEVMEVMEGSGEVEPPAYLKAQVAMEIARHERKDAFSWMQIAAAVTILVVGFSLGKWSGADSSGELSQLMGEIQQLREATLTNTLQRHSASERILAVNRIEEKTSINKELLQTLTNTLNSDESPNVRYAALQALKKFIGQEQVRAELVKSLASQSDALIQISLITILVEAEEKSAIVPLNEIIENEEITPEVKQQAQIALKVLT